MFRDAQRIARSLCWIALVGCTAPDAAREIAVKEIPGAGATPQGGWESAPFPTAKQCQKAGGQPEWIEFSGRTTITVPHELGRRPTQVLLYIAFDPAGCDSTLASGDVAKIASVDDDRIVLENSTHEVFGLRIYLE